MPTNAIETEKAPTEFMKAKEVAKFLGICHKTVCNQAEQGIIPGKQLGSIWLFRRSTIEKLVP